MIRLSLVIYFFLLISLAKAQLDNKSWKKNCIKDANNKENCAIAILNQVEDKDKKLINFATAFVLKSEEIIKSKDKDKDAKEAITKKPVILFVINLPLNVDLTAKPQVQIDNKKAFDINFTNCNQNDGCKSMGVISNENFEKLKKSKTFSVITRVYGTNSNIKIDFPLKDFESEFKKL